MIPNEGMPAYRHHNTGNMYIRFDVEFPEPNWTDADTIAKLEGILPPRQPLRPRSALETCWHVAPWRP